MQKYQTCISLEPDAQTSKTQQKILDYIRDNLPAIRLQQYLEDEKQKDHFEKIGLPREAFRKILFDF